MSKPESTSKSVKGRALRQANFCGFTILLPECMRVTALLSVACHRTCSNRCIEVEWNTDLEKFCLKFVTGRRKGQRNSHFFWEKLATATETHENQQIISDCSQRVHLVRFRPFKAP